MWIHQTLYTVMAITIIALSPNAVRQSDASTSLARHWSSSSGSTGCAGAAADFELDVSASACVALPAAGGDGGGGGGSVRVQCDFGHRFVLSLYPDAQCREGGLGAQTALATGDGNTCVEGPLLNTNSSSNSNSSSLISGGSWTVQCVVPTPTAAAAEESPGGLDFTMTLLLALSFSLLAVMGLCCSWRCTRKGGSAVADSDQLH